MMRRATLLVLASLVATLLTSGVALAATITGNDKNNVLYGTKDPDVLDGKGGADALFGRAGNDTLYGGKGNDNFKTTLTDKNGNQVTAGLRGGKGDDTLEGQQGNDDLMGHGGNDTLKDISPRSTSKVTDWDRAFGGPGNDDIDVADGDYRDEVICSEGLLNEPDNTDWDKAKIDVERDSSGNITRADTVYEEGSDGKPVTCEEVKDQNGNPVNVSDLPQSSTATAPAEPVATTADVE